MSTVPIQLAAMVCLSLHMAAELSRGFLQNSNATKHTRQSKQNWGNRAEKFWSVDILVPCYNENPKLLDACLSAIADQDYQGRLQVFIVDDGSKNREELHPVLKRYEEKRDWSVWLLTSNGGKRLAMNEVLWQSDGELVVVVDSDTELEPDAISEVVKPFADPQVAGVSASNCALNAKSNLLTRLIDRSYRMLFEKERAAQSYFRAVLCCHGAFAAYRRTALKEVWNRHLGRYKTGEDLHLTLRLLEADYDTVLQARAVARTTVPETLRDYARQQRRWSRSFIRDSALAGRVIARRSPRAYLFFDLVVQATSPVLFAMGVLLAAVQVLVFDLGGLAWAAGWVGSTIFVTSLVATVRARAASYLLYEAVYYGVVLPGALLALVSFWRDSWKTRNLVPRRVRFPVLRSLLSLRNS